MPSLSWILDGVCSCLDGGCQISMDKKQWLLEAGLPQASLLLSNNACTYLDAISTIMAIVLLNLNAKYLFVTFGLAFEFGYFY